MALSLMNPALDPNEAVSDADSAVVLVKQEPGTDTISDSQLRSVAPQENQVQAQVPVFDIKKEPGVQEAEDNTESTNAKEPECVILAHKVAPPKKAKAPRKRHADDLETLEGRVGDGGDASGGVLFCLAAVRVSDSDSK
jgi:hypothetical protein